MKKLSFLLVCLFLLSLTSCSSDDDSSSSGNGTINGEWKITAMNFEGHTDSSDMSMNFSGEAIDLDDNDKVNFHDDNTFTSETDGFTMKITVEFMGQENTQETQVDAVFGEGTWTKDGNTLTITDGDTQEATTYEIQTLNGSTLKMTTDLSSIGADVPNPDGDEMDGNATITMKR